MDAFAKSMDTFFVDCNRNIHDDVNAFTNRHMMEREQISQGNSFKKTGGENDEAENSKDNPDEENLDEEKKSKKIFKNAKKMLTMATDMFTAKRTTFLCAVFIIYCITVLPIHVWVGSSMDNGKHIFFLILDFIFLILLVMFSYFSWKELQKNASYMPIVATTLCICSLSITMNILHSITDKNAKFRTCFSLLLFYLVIIAIYLWMNNKETGASLFDTGFLFVSITAIIVSYVLLFINMNANKNWLVLPIIVLILTVVGYLISAGLIGGGGDNDGGDNDGGDNDGGS